MKSVDLGKCSRQKKGVSQRPTRTWRRAVASGAESRIYFPKPHIRKGGELEY